MAQVFIPNRVYILYIFILNHKFVLTICDYIEDIHVLPCSFVRSNDVKVSQVIKEMVKTNLQRIAM